MENKFSSTVSFYGPKTIKVEVVLDINRKLTDDEDEFVRICINKIINLVHQNDVIHDPKRIEERNQEKIDLLACFPDKIYVKEIPNCYSADIVNPWFLVTTSKGIIKIGWRKRVINIDWTESDVEAKPEDLFPNENVTKSSWGDKYIHADSYEKAKEYITKILNS